MGQNITTRNLINIANVTSLPQNITYMMMTTDDFDNKLKSWSLGIVDENKAFFLQAVALSKTCFTTYKVVATEFCPFGQVLNVPVN